MELVRTVTRQSAFIAIPLALLALIPDWESPGLRFLGFFGPPRLMPGSILIGTLLGIVNLRGMAWGIESLLGAVQENTKLVVLSLIRLFVVFAVIFVLAALRLVNLLGLLAGMTVVFLLLIREGLRLARRD